MPGWSGEAAALEVVDIIRAVARTLPGGGDAERLIEFAFLIYRIAIHQPDSL